MRHIVKMKVTKKLDGFVFERPYSDLGHVTLDIPAGLMVVPTEDKEGGWFLNRFPPGLFPFGSSVRTDAIMRGVRLTDDQVEDKP